jgi:hypothetical protein
MGPYQYAVHLMSGPRLPFTAAYFGSIVMTIYFAVGVRAKTACATRMIAADYIPIAPFHYPDPLFVHCAACGVGVVSCQLFSHGQHWTALCCPRGRRKDGRVDE